MIQTITLFQLNYLKFPFHLLLALIHFEGGILVQILISSLMPGGSISDAFFPKVLVTQCHYGYMYNYYNQRDEKHVLCEHKLIKSLLVCKRKIHYTDHKELL